MLMECLRHAILWNTDQTKKREHHISIEHCILKNFSQKSFLLIKMVLINKYIIVLSIFNVLLVGEVHFSHKHLMDNLVHRSFYKYYGINDGFLQY